MFGSAMAMTETLFIPVESNIDLAAEKEKINKEIQRLEQFKNSIEKKLNNERFVAGAPDDLVARERKKLDDSITKLDSLRQEINRLAAAE
jgi:valyl-tRNA synthetase